MKMKKLLWMAFTSLLVLGSCSQEENLSQQSQTLGKDQLTASFEGRSSRASIKNNSLVWSENDQIAVLGENVIAPFVLFEGAETGSGSFAGTMPDNAECVVFPYNDENPASISGNTLSMTLPNALTDITKCNLPMWSTLDDVTIHFKHLVGLLAVSVNDIPAGCSKLVLETSNVIAGNFTADLSLNEVTLVAASGNVADENKKVTITFDEVEGNDNDRLFYIPLPVGSYSTVKVSLAVGNEMKTLVQWSNKVVQRAKIYSTSLTYTSVDASTTTTVSSALEEQFKVGGTDEISAPESPIQIDLTSAVTATTDPIVLPAASEGGSSDITMNFNETPDTENNPLVVQQNAGAEQGASVNALAINMPADAVIKDMVIDSPTSTVTLNGGTYEKLKVSSALNTTVIGSDVEIWGLEVVCGNVRIQKGGKITGSLSYIGGNDDEKIYVILETGATIENSLPADFVVGEHFVIVNAAEYDLREAVALGGTVVLSEDVNLLNSLEISSEVTIDLNGKSVKCNTSDVFVVLAGGKLTLNDANNKAVVWGSEDNSSSSCAVWAKGGDVIINGGIYKVGHDASSTDPNNKRNDCIYAGTNNGTNPGGNIIINGGVFEYTGTEQGGDNFLLNLADNDTSNPSIVVKGGKFYNFNPADNAAEGAGTNFVHDDYKSVLVSGTSDQYEVVLKGFVLTASGEYEIRTTDGLFEFAAAVEAGETFAGKTIKLTTDVNLKYRPWTPIGAARSSVDNADVIFQGNFDGQNHAIKNMEVFTNEYRFIGLFATTHGATIQNVTFVGGEVKAADCTFTSVYAGAVVGYARGTYIINCHNKGCAITATRSDDQRGGWIGGIVGGHTYLDDINPVCIACTNAATITCPYLPSGIAGGSYGGCTSYVACVNTGDIVVTGTHQEGKNVFASGVVGEMGGENYMYSCFSDCSIPDSDYNHGALTGDAGGSAANIHYSYSTVTNVSLLGQCWGTINETVSVVSSYSEAVDDLNAGIELYNQTATVPCNYRFVAGDKPTLQLQ